jgi:ribosome-associated protein
MAAMDSESIRSEVAFRFSRSSGPGGQHAQKSSTRVEALFDVEGSTALTERERRLVLARLGPVVRATERILDQLRDATKVERPRRPTRPTKASQERRLDEKKRRGQTKRRRGTVDDG